MKENKDITPLSFAIERIKENLEKEIKQRLFIIFIPKAECASKDKISFWRISTTQTGCLGIGLCIIYYLHSNNNIINFLIHKENIEYIKGSHTNVRQIIRNELEKL